MLPAASKTTSRGDKVLVPSTPKPSPSPLRLTAGEDAARPRQGWPDSPSRSRYRAAGQRRRAVAGGGTWKEEGNTTVIMWNTGWTTKIAKEGDQYKKTAYGKGLPLDGPPTNSTDAQKEK